MVWSLSMTSCLLKASISGINKLTITLNNYIFTDLRKFKILAQDSTRPNHVSAPWTVLLELPVVVLNTGSAEFVETLFDCEWVLEDVEADGAVKHLLHLVEKINIYILVAILFLLTVSQPSWSQIPERIFS